MMDGPQLLNDDALAWIGHEYQPRRVSVAAQDIQRFAYASREPAGRVPSGDPDASVEAPPMFYVVLRTMPFQVAPLDTLDVDGTISDDLPPIPVSRGMAGEIEIEFGRPIRSGDVVTITKKIVDLVEKSGRSGPFVIITFLTEYRDANAELLVRERFGRILR